LARVQAIASWATVPLLGEPLQLLDRFGVFAEVLALEELRERLQLVEGELRSREDDQVHATVLGIVAGVQVVDVCVGDLHGVFGSSPPNASSTVRASRVTPTMWNIPIEPWLANEAPRCLRPSAVGDPSASTNTGKLAHLQLQLQRLPGRFAQLHCLLMAL
jgi:hypothetical protein